MERTANPTFFRVLHRDEHAHSIAVLGAALVATPIVFSIEAAVQKRESWGFPWIFLVIGAVVLAGACLRVAWIRGLILRGEHMHAVLTSVFSYRNRTKLTYDYEFRGQKYFSDRSIRTRVTLRHGDPLGIVVDPDRPSRSVPVQLF